MATVIGEAHAIANAESDKRATVVMASYCLMLRKSPKIKDFLYILLILKGYKQ